jgi:predicted ester cyclase
MSAEEENKKLALTVIEALNTRDLDPWSQNLSDDYVAEYPDTHFDVNSVVTQGDQVFIHWTVSGTQAERLATVTGRTIPPTQRRATVSGVLLTEARDDKIVREGWYWDQLSLLDQLGIMEHPGLFLTHEGF